MTIFERLKRLDSGALSDALDRLGLEGVVTGLRALTGVSRIAGRVMTVQLARAEGRTSSRHLGTAAIEAAEAGDVLVVEHHERSDCAGWGGLLSLAAQTRGLAGTIVDGAVRDVDESREMGYPVFGRSAVPRTARGRVVEAAWNVPVRIGEIVVRPFDLVLADGSGIVFVSAGKAEEVLTAAEAIAERESLLAEAVRAGREVSAVLGEDYEQLLKEKRDG